MLPDGETLKVERSWATGGNAVFIDYKYAQSGGHPDVKTAYDVLGRNIATQTGGFNNQILTQTYTYDARGDIIGQTAPYYANETPVTTTTQYDNYNRISRVSTPLNYTETNYANIGAGKIKVTVTNSAGQASSKTQDGSGRVISANDNGGQLNYIYDSWGNVISTSIGSTTLLTTVYDIYNRKTSLTDKNAGTISYKYDALGEPIQQKDAMNHVYNIVYDDFGRITSKSGSEGITAYTYYSSGNKNNDKPASITGPAGDVTTYTYDNLSRKISQITTIDGTNYTDRFAYDGYGNLIKTTYASGIVINEIYDGNGIPKQTTLQDEGNTTTIFTATSLNSRGIYTGYLMGNGKAS